MSAIPIRVTEERFNVHIHNCLSKAKRGDVCRIPLDKNFPSWPEAQHPREPTPPQKE